MFEKGVKKFKKAMFSIIIGGQKAAASDVRARPRHRRNDVSSRRRRPLDLRDVQRRPDVEERLQAG